MPNPPTQDQPTTVLVVDDEDGIRQALDRFLSRLGYRVLQASSGAEALDRQAVDLDELELSLQGALRQRQLEVDRRELEQWLAREVAVRTRDLEERTTVVEDIALAALAAAGDWPGASDAVEKLAKELGTSADDVAREVRKRRGGS